jgi:hypothetical protein
VLLGLSARAQTDTKASQHQLEGNFEQETKEDNQDTIFKGFQ